MPLSRPLPQPPLAYRALVMISGLGDALTLPAVVN